MDRERWNYCPECAPEGGGLLPLAARSPFSTRPHCGVKEEDSLNGFSLGKNPSVSPTEFLKHVVLAKVAGIPFVISLPPPSPRPGSSRVPSYRWKMGRENGRPPASRVRFHSTSGVQRLHPRC